jgi:hypothetical protein
LPPAFKYIWKAGLGDRALAEWSHTSFAGSQTNGHRLDASK